MLPSAKRGAPRLAACRYPLPSKRLAFPEGGPRPSGAKQAPGPKAQRKAEHLVLGIASRCEASVPLSFGKELKAKCPLGRRSRAPLLRLRSARSQGRRKAGPLPAERRSAYFSVNCAEGSWIPSWKLAQSFHSLGAQVHPSTYLRLYQLKDFFLRLLSQFKLYE